MLRLVIAAFLALACGMPNMPDLVRWPTDREAHQLTAATLRIPPCVPDTPLLDSQGIGPVHIGLTAAEVYARCPGAVALWDWGDEAIPEPVLVVRLGDAQVVAAFADTLPGSLLYRATVTGSAARTSEEVGPGSSLPVLRRAYGSPATVEAAECVLTISFTVKPGLAWRLRLPERMECEQIHQIADSGPDAALPDSTHVEAVVLFASAPGT